MQSLQEQPDLARAFSVSGSTEPKELTERSDDTQEAVMNYPYWIVLKIGWKISIRAWALDRGVTDQLIQTQQS